MRNKTALALILGISSVATLAPPALATPLPAAANQSPSAASSSDTDSDSGTVHAAGVVAFQSMVDDPHHSKDVPGTVSVHGWWKRGNAKPGTKALVEVSLQAKRNGTWVTVARQRVTVADGGGRGRRAVAAAKCRSSKQTWFRGQVDVDLIGVWDDRSRPFSRDVSLACSPW